LEWKTREALRSAFCASRAPALLNQGLDLLRRIKRRPSVVYFHDPRVIFHDPDQPRAHTSGLSRLLARPPDQPTLPFIDCLQWLLLGKLGATVVVLQDCSCNVASCCSRRHHTAVRDLHHKLEGRRILFCQFNHLKFPVISPFTIQMGRASPIEAVFSCLSYIESQIPSAEASQGAGTRAALFLDHPKIHVLRSWPSDR